MPLSPEPLSDFARHIRAFEEYLWTLDPRSLTAEEKRVLTVLHGDLLRLVKEQHERES